LQFNFLFVGLSTVVFLINFGSGYLPAGRQVRCKSGTRPALPCHTELVEVHHRAFRFYPAAFEREESICAGEK
jgi:hypothetical protein